MFDTYHSEYFSFYHFVLFQDVYETFNILLRRKPKENNFKVDVDKYFKFHSGFHLFPWRYM